MHRLIPSFHDGFLLHRNCHPSARQTKRNRSPQAEQQNTRLAPLRYHHQKSNERTTPARCSPLIHSPPIHSLLSLHTPLPIYPLFLASTSTLPTASLRALPRTITALNTTRLVCIAISRALSAHRKPRACSRGLRVFLSYTCQ